MSRNRSTVLSEEQGREMREECRKETFKNKYEVLVEGWMVRCLED